ncbi:MAG: hypothetical protein JWO82_2413 [Akkermansiaceae bacterium]|nr:hypothetical protein [Akkermansiaceae bacterium]
MSKLKSFGAAALALITALGALDPSKFLPFLPPDVAHWVPIVLAACATIAHFFSGVAKVAEDAGPKTPAQSLVPLLLIAAVCTLALGMTSCNSTVPWSVTTPYGNLNSSQGNTVYTPPAAPIVMHGGK